MNTQEMEEKAMRDQLQAVEKEIALAKVELAEKDNIYKNQQKLIVELQAKYKFELEKRNEKSLQPKPKTEIQQSKEPRDITPRMKATCAPAFQNLSHDLRQAQQGSKIATQQGALDSHSSRPQLTVNNAPAQPSAKKTRKTRRKKHKRSTTPSEFHTYS